MILILGALIAIGPLSINEGTQYFTKRPTELAVYGCENTAMAFAAVSMVGLTQFCGGLVP